MSIASLGRIALLTTLVACSATPRPAAHGVVAPSTDELLSGDELVALVPPVEEPEVETLGERELALLQLERLSAGAEALTAGDPLAALRQLDPLLDAEPDHATGRYLRGVALMKVGHDSDALVDLERAIELSPDDPGPYGLVARLRADRGDVAGAIDALRSSIELGLDEAWSHATLGHLLLDDGRWIEAHDALMAAVERDPHCVSAHRGLAMLFSTIGDAERAAQAYRAVLSTEPDEVGALVGLGHALRDLGDETAALEVYEKARALEPQRGLHAANVAATLFELGRLRDAIDAYEASLDLPDTRGLDEAVVHLSIGAVLERLGDIAGAIDAYEWALDVDPALGLAHEALGLLAHDRGDARTAARHLATAMHLGALEPASLVALAQLRERDGDGAGVRDVVSVLAGIEPRTSDVAFALAALHVRSDVAGVRDVQAGEALLSPHLDATLSDSGSAWHLMSEALAAQGRFAEAVDAIDRALDVIESTGPRHADYLRRRDRYVAEHDARN